MYKYKIVIGDYSNDGHGQAETYYFSSNISGEEIKAAYKVAIEECGVSLHDQDGWSKSGKWKNRKNAICCDYEDSSISNEIRQKLVDFGVNFSDFDSIENDNGALGLSPEDIAKLFLEMVRCVRKDFIYKITNDEVECLNGWGGLRVGFGYGCF